MDDQILTFVLLLVGFILLGVELLLPTGGIVGVMCAVSFLSSAYFAHHAWSETNPLYWRIYIVTFLALIPITLSGVYYLLTKTAFGNRVLLAAPSTEEVTPYQEQHHHLESLIGQHGTAISPLKPGGLVQINGERLHAVGHGFIIESGESVEIVEIQGTRVVVKPVSAAQNSVRDPEENFNPEDQIDPKISQTPQRNEIIDPFAETDPS